VAVSLSLSRLIAGATVLIDRPVQLSVGRTARLALVGDNGAGKTTLLTALRRGCTFGEEHLLWLPQELDAAEGEAELAATRRCRPTSGGGCSSCSTCSEWTPTRCCGRRRRHRARPASCAWPVG